MLDTDPFRLFRYMLGWIVTIYATIISAQSLWGWYLYFASGDKYTTLLRRYVMLQGLRLRFRTFWGDLIICILLTVAFFLLWHAQGIFDYIEDTTKAINATRTITHA